MRCVSVVGYQNLEVKSQQTSGGYSWLLNTLPAVGKAKEDLTFGDFKVVTPDGGLLDQYSVQVVVYGDAGQEVGMYSYVDEAAISIYGWPCDPGWYTTASLEDYSCVSANDVVIPFGYGFMVISNCGASLTCAGEVAKGATDITINSQTTSGGYTWTGNCSPVDLTFKEIGIIAPEGGLLDQYSVQVVVYGDAGQEVGMYSYVDEVAISIYGWPCDPGWYTTASLEDYSCVSAADVELKAGQMVMIISNCGATWSVPSAL